MPALINNNVAVTHSVPSVVAAAAASDEFRFLDTGCVPKPRQMSSGMERSLPTR